MSRRDTIIVAILVNAGLLIVLFASALKSNVSGQDLAARPTAVMQEPKELALKRETPLIVGDEVDVALQHYAQTSALSAQPQVNPTTSMATLPSPPSNVPSQAPVNFADDLKAFTFAETPVAPQAPAVVAEAPQDSPAPAFIEFKVKKGDVLEKIARHHQTTVAEIMKVNRLANTNLRIGQVLKIPNKSMRKSEAVTQLSSSPASLPSMAASSEAGPKYYTVKKGDNPWTIAVKNHVKVEDLLKLNDMSEDQARRLKPGDQLRIR